MGWLRPKLRKNSKLCPGLVDHYKMALEVARKKLEMLRKDFDTWEATTVGADYPEGE